MPREWVIKVVVFAAIIGGIAWGIYTLSKVGGKCACEFDKGVHKSPENIFPF